MTLNLPRLQASRGKCSNHGKWLNPLEEIVVNGAKRGQLPIARAGIGSSPRFAATGRSQGKREGSRFLARVWKSEGWRRVEGPYMESLRPEIRLWTFILGSVGCGSQHETQAAGGAARADRRCNFMGEGGATISGRRLAGAGAGDLERASLGTPYPEVVDRVVQVTRSRNLAGRCHLAVDGTGVAGQGRGCSRSACGLWIAYVARRSGFIVPDAILGRVCSCRAQCFRAWLDQ